MKEYTESNYVSRYSPHNEAFEKKVHRESVISLGHIVLFFLIGIMVGVAAKMGFNPIEFVMGMLSQAGPMPWQFETIIDWLHFIL